MKRPPVWWLQKAAPGAWWMDKWEEGEKDWKTGRVREERQGYDKWKVTTGEGNKK